MPDDLLIKTVGLAIFVAVIGGSTYAAYNVIYPHGLEVGGVVVQAVGPLEATAGRDFAVPFKVANPLDRAQVFRVSVEGEGFASFSPVKVTVPPKGEASASIAVSADPDLAPGPRTFSLVARAEDSPERAGRAPVSVVLAEPGLRVSLPFPVLNVSPGARFDLPVIVNATDGIAHLVRVEARADALTVLEGALDLTVGTRSGEGGFFAFEVPSGQAPGDVQIVVEAVTTGGTPLQTRATATVRVLGPGEGLPAEGGEGEFLYAGRIAGTGLFNTNFPALDAEEFPRDELYRLSTGVLPVTTGEHTNVVRGFANAVVGMQVGESRAFAIPPAQAYGEATIEERQNRTVALERDVALPAEEDEIPRARFDQFIQSSNQGAGADFKAGDVFRFKSGPNNWPFRIASIDDQVVRYRLDPSAEESYTLYPFWEGASKLVAKNATHVTFRTNPTTEVGAAFTYHEYWVNGTTLSGVNETKILLRHSPVKGSTYEVAQGPFAPATVYTVVDVTETEIVTRHPNPSPLGGKTLVFFVTRVS